MMTGGSFDGRIAVRRFGWRVRRVGSGFRRRIGRDQDPSGRARDPRWRWIWEAPRQDSLLLDRIGGVDRPELFLGYGLKDRVSDVREMFDWLRLLVWPRHLHCGADFSHGLFGPCVRPIGSILEDILNLAGGEARSPLLDGIQHLDQCVGGPAFALDASDAGRTAAFVNLGQCLRRREDLVQIADGALVRIAGIFAADAGRVGDHRLQLLCGPRTRDL